MKFYAVAGTVCLLFCAMLSCTPKTTEETTSSQPVNQGKPMYSDDPCATFDDSKAGQAALDAHVIYRDYMRVKRYGEAMPLWRQAYKAAPAADGKRQTHFEDGIDLYEDLISKTDNDSHKLRYLDTIFQIYDHLGTCYHADDPGYIEARKAFDLYYKYKALVGNQKIYDHFSKALDIYGIDAPAFVVNPFTALLVEMYYAKEIDKQEARDKAGLILDITDKHVDDVEEGWPIVLSYAPSRLEDFETIRDFFDCTYYQDKYYSEVQLDSVDCEELVLIISRLLWGGCGKESPEVETLYQKYRSNCRIMTVDTLLAKARTALEEGRYEDAIEHYKKYLEDETDPEVLAKFNLRIANIYYGHLKRFSKAREFAYKALEHRPNWGEPYIVIGKLYASSGPLCGPGRGWDSQIVTWPAIDKFQQAKRVDPTVAPEANKWIRYYERFMPSVEDIFQRQLKEGDTFKVPCWIQETTRIRAAKPQP